MYEKNQHDIEKQELQLQLITRDCVQKDNLIRLMK